MKRTIMIMLAWALAAVSTVCSANGGPVDWSTGRPLGGLVPKQQSDIELLREDLEITVLDLDTYSVEAKYTLSNPGEARKVLYGVPLHWVTELKPDAAAGIGISVNGRGYQCNAVKPAKGAGDLNGKFGDFGPSGVTSCVAELEIPQGTSISLRLTYEAKFEYIDWESNKSSQRYFDERYLDYPLAPAGYWKGKPDFHARLKLGPYAGSVKKVTPQAKVSKGLIEWKVPDADLKKLKMLKVDFDSKPLFRYRQLSNYNRDARPHERFEAQAKASSTLPHKANRYAAANVLDGDPATAWCEGKKGNGEGESIAVRFDPKEEGSCRPEGFAIIPGYAKSKQTYLQNGRVSKMRIEVCNDPSTYAVVRWQPDDINTRSAIFVHTARTFEPYGGDEFLQEKAGEWAPKELIGDGPIPSCLRFTILETVGGERYSDTCISELVLLRVCS